MPRTRHPTVLLLLLVAAACGGGTAPAGPPAALEAVNPGPFTGTVGEPLTDPLAVRVTDANGRLVAGAVVRFSVTQGNGSVSVGGLGATALDDSTDNDGVARVAWDLGTMAGPQLVRASLLDLTPVEFSATALAGPAVAATITDASAFIAPVSSPTDEPLAVRVEDSFGNAVGGALVNWVALSAGATVAAASTTSDANGVATVGATLGAAPGLYLFRATPVGGAADTIGVIAVTAVTDPVGDQAPIVDPAYASHDVTHFGAVVIQDVLVLYAKFAATISPAAGTPGRFDMVANYDLDLDGDSLTGFYTLRQCVGGDSLGFGADAFVDLDPRSGFLTGQTGVPAGAVAVLRVDSLLDADRCTSRFNGALYATVPAYQPTTVSLGVPLSFFGDDGAMSITNLFVHPATTVTDIVPDSLAWDFVPTVTVQTAAGADALDVWRFLAAPRPTGGGVAIDGAPRPRRRIGR